MKHFLIACLIGVAVLVAAATSHANVVSNDKVRTVGPGGIRSANAATGPVVNGLALSLSDRQFNMRKHAGYTWLALELRNESAQLRWIFGFGKLADIRVTITDGSGRSVPTYKYPKIDFDPPVSTNGMPLSGGNSIWLAVPIEALAPIQKPGTYVVQAKTLATVDARNGEPIELISNPLTVRL